VDGAASIGISLGPSQLDAFEAYASAILEWGRRLNLTRILSPEGIVRRHFLDSLACLTAIPDTPGLAIVDIGSGAGFPGVPVKIARPDLRLTLIEASRKRVAFLEMLVMELGLEIGVLHGRAEEISRQIGQWEAYDVVTARATAPLERLVSLCLPFLRVGGTAVFPKGIRAETEVRNAMGAISALGGDVMGIKPAKIRGLEGMKRVIVILRKVRSVPPSGRRRVGIQGA
jgi:16S rRNA (guanine527-N7)-methyltransferase